jgi:hypothetical protein
LPRISASRRCVADEGQHRRPRSHQAGERLNLPGAGVHSQLRDAVPCGEGELPEKPLRRPRSSARLRIIGLKKCLVPETVTVNLPGPDRRTGGNKIKVSGRLSGKWCLRGPVWGLRTLVCARVLPDQAFYLRLQNRAVIYGKEKVYGSIP